MSASGLRVIPISLAEANAYVEQKHRHHHKVTGHKFSIACAIDGEIHGVAIVGRPLARHLDDGSTLEVLRCCTDGTKNACSILYGRCAKIAKEMGYQKIITYILRYESGASLKASGYVLEQENCGGGSWSVPSRPRETSQLSLYGDDPKYPTIEKKRYAKFLS